MADRERSRRFEQTMLPHLDAAYSYARWIVRNPHDAQDVVQEAYLRALRYFDGFSGSSGKGWLLGIVRNAAFDWLHRNRPAGIVPNAAPDGEDTLAEGVDAETPETRFIETQDRALLERLIGELPDAFREVLVLREIEAMSYAEIAAVAGIPAGTVMSRLARARAMLQKAWRRATKEVSGGM
ncbi:MAG: sigma-70 family RNA polymerase sigma factor [Proteobacteria bacterium]|nr:sigma-70 family RNA polymerase sigma factor [Pseudomonadota bacterium]